MAALAGDAMRLFTAVFVTVIAAFFGWVAILVWWERRR